MTGSPAIDWDYIINFDITNPSIPTYALTVTQKGSLSPPPHETEAFALVMDGWKLIHHTRPEEGTREFELFDHRSDPFNLKDVSEQYPQIVVKLNKELQRWKSDVARVQLPRAEDLENLDSEELKRLRSLGYIQ